MAEIKNNDQKEKKNSTTTNNLLLSLFSYLRELHCTTAYCLSRSSSFALICSVERALETGSKVTIINYLKDKIQNTK
jgi:hypothetical protein